MSKDTVFSTPGRWITKKQKVLSVLAAVPISIFRNMEARIRKHRENIDNLSPFVRLLFIKQFFSWSLNKMVPKRYYTENGLKSKVLQSPSRIHRCYCPSFVTVSTENAVLFNCNEGNLLFQTEASIYHRPMLQKAFRSKSMIQCRFKTILTLEHSNTDYLRCQVSLLALF